MRFAVSSTKTGMKMLIGKTRYLSYFTNLSRDWYAHRSPTATRNLELYEQKVKIVTTHHPEFNAKHMNLWRNTCIASSSYSSAFRMGFRVFQVGFRVGFQVFRVGFRVFRVGFRVGFRVFRVGFRVFRVGFRVFRGGSGCSGWGSGCSGWGSGFFRHPIRLNSLLISYEKLGKLYNKFIKVMLCVSLICLNIIHKEK